jgi:hypothetical protein
VQLTVFAARESARFFHRLVDTLQQLADFLQKKFSFCRQRYARGLRRKRSTPISSSKS